MLPHLRKLNPYFRKYKYHFILGVIFVLISNAFGVLPPILIRESFNAVRDFLEVYQLADGLESQSALLPAFTQTLIVFALAVIGMAIGKGIFMFFMRQTLIVMSRLIENDLRNSIYAQYQKLDQAFFKRNRVGDLMNRATEDVSRVRMYLGPAILYAINTTCMTIFVITVMFTVNAKLAMIVLIPLPILSVSIYYVNNIINKKSERIQSMLSNLTSITQEVFNGIRVIKSFRLEKQQAEMFAESTSDYKKANLSLARTEAMFFPLMLLLIGMSTILAVFVGGTEVINGTLEAGNIAEFIIYVGMLTWPVTSLGWIAALVQRAETSMERINKFLEQQPSVENNSEPIPISSLEGNIVFENVSMVYPDTGIKALDNVSFNIKAGERVAIVGRTGSGKSTIADLLVRSYDTSEGEIRIDSMPIQDVDVFQYRSRIGYVPQDVFLFSDTISNNISFGWEKKPEPEQVLEMANAASVKHDIEGLPKGFDTIVGERGVTLSGGQKQRISIARSFLHNPDVIILDDCLSAVDANTEATIIHSLDTLLEGKTSIVITHRISSKMEFDKIIVLHEGKVAEIGTHDELSQKEGYYSDLLNLQNLEENI